MQPKSSNCSPISPVTIIGIVTCFTIREKKNPAFSPQPQAFDCHACVPTSCRKVSTKRTANTHRNSPQQKKSVSRSAQRGYAFSLATFVVMIEAIPFALFAVTTVASKSPKTQRHIFSAWLASRRIRCARHIATHAHIHGAMEIFPRLQLPWRDQPMSTMSVVSYIWFQYWFDCRAVIINCVRDFTRNGINYVNNETKRTSKQRIWLNNTYPWEAFRIFPTEFGQTYP